MTTSPLMTLPGAVATPEGTEIDPGLAVDAGLAWHYGDPLGEQRAAERGAVLLDRWNAEALTVSGEERLTWLHSLCTQHMDRWRSGDAAEALWLSPRGHVEHWADAAELDCDIRLVTEPGRSAALVAFLESMVFWSKVEVRPATESFAVLTVAGPQAADIVTGALAVDHAVAPGRAAAVSAGPAVGGWLRVHAGADASPGRIDIAVPRTNFGHVAQRIIAAGARPAGTWAGAALRVVARRPRFGVDNDERTIPNETPWLDTAVHLNKGCYRGQETVARVDNLGAPPRRLVMLNLDGSGDNLPRTGDPVTTSDGSGSTGRTVGRVGTVAQHWEDGPIALALVKRTIGPDVPLHAGGVDAAVDPADEPIVARAAGVDRASLPRFDRR